MGRRTSFLATVLAVVTIAPAPAADPPGSVREVTAALAAKVKEVCGGTQPRQTAVRLGLFTGTQDALALGAGGGAFMADLEVALAGFVSPTAAFELNGHVLFVDDPEKAGLKVIKVKAKLVDKNGDEPAAFKEFVGFVRATADVSRITGVTVAFKPDAEYDGLPSDGKNKDLQRALPPGPGKPPAVTPFVKGTVVRSTEGGKYEVEILAGKEPDKDEAFRPLTPTVGDKQFPGVPVVDLDKDTYYRVRVRNTDTQEVGVFLHLDGIDQFAFSENRAADGRPTFRCWVVEPGQEVVVKGWHGNVSPGKVFGFLTTEAGKGAASKFPTKIPEKVGTICVSIAHTKPDGTKGPGLETATGAPIAVEQKPVKRVIAEPHEFITVRYSR
jgi:hypothetical protein